ncbi:hypothetical protein ACQCVE_04510 [Metabacillus sp. 113a]|uniref:hypothetical protein n=1 Tax=Metabacillus sp. 113a TaxID=3404706 RepID=UPI003CEBC80B
MTDRIGKIIKFFEYMRPNVNINVYRSSQDPEVRSLLSFFGAEGAAALNLDTGAVDISINDDVFRKAMIYEELGHALQYHRDGHVEVGSIDYFKREIEVSMCLIERSFEERIKLSADEVKQTEINLKAYQEKLRNLGG